MKNKIKKVLIANRGEIAIRIFHTLNKLNINAIGIYAKEDLNSYHRMIIPCYDLGEGSLRDTYLNIEKIIDIAKKNQCNAIHPGYGFLSENYEFAKRCEEENLIFIGPTSHAIHLMGDKLRSKNLAKKLNIPILESITGTVEDIYEYIMQQNDFPLLVKASAGGGGKGMKIIESKNGVKEILESASREAMSYFGNPEIYVEKYIQNPRHIEVQIVSSHSQTFHLFERECSIQRRHQKIIEEAPSPSLTKEERKKIYEYAIQLAREINYTSLGTIEFLYDENSKKFYFLEMNTRIQVEHPVTEMITGLDLVKLQIEIIEKEKLNLKQEEIIAKGHSIEARIYAEDPENNFAPSPGKILAYIEPQIANIRIDSSLKYPTNIPSQFDPMISKIISWGNHREEAIENMIFALENYIIHGTKTNIDYLMEIFKSEDFKENKISTNFIKKFQYEKKIPSDIINLCLFLHSKKNLPFQENQKETTDIWNYIGYWRNVYEIPKPNVEFLIKEINNENYEVIINNQTHILKKIYEIALPSYNYFILEWKNNFYHCYMTEDRNYLYITVNGINDRINKQKKELIPSDTEIEISKIHAPMPGKIIKVLKKTGEEIQKGEVIMILESMKMENQITSSKNGIIKNIFAKENDVVETYQELAEID